MPSPSPSDPAALEAVIARTAPAILELLADGVARSRPAIAAALAARHDRRDVTLTLMRLAVTGRLDRSGGKYALGPEAG